MKLITTAPVPCYAVREIIGCEGCMFNRHKLLIDGSACSEPRSSWRSVDDIDCVRNNSIYIPATPAGITAYQRAFDAHQIKLITIRLTQ